MAEPKEKTGLWRTERATWAYLSLAWGSAIVATVLVAVTLLLAASRGFERFVALGLLQPMVAAFLAFAIVMVVRTVKGRFVGERRKGTTSASSATIAVRLWALCFALLAGAMLLFEALALLPSRLAPPPPNVAATAEAQVEFKGSPNPAVARIKVSR